MVTPRIRLTREKSNDLRDSSFTRTSSRRADGTIESHKYNPKPFPIKIHQMSHILHLDRASVQDINFFSTPTTTVQEYFQKCIDQEENEIHRRILKEILSCIQTIEKNYNLYHDTAVTPTWRVRTRSRISDLTRLVVAVGDSKAVALLSLFLHRKRGFRQKIDINCYFRLFIRVLLCLFVV